MFNKQNLSISFFFGAGAEGEGQYYLPSGATFKRNCLLLKGSKKLFSLLNPDDQVFLSYWPKTLLYSNAYSCLWQSLQENASEIDFHFTDDERTIIEEYRNLVEGKCSNLEAEEKKKIRNSFADLYREYIYKPLKQGGDSLPDYLGNISFYGFIDSNFNCLRRPALYKSECARILALYCSAYSSVAQELGLSLDEIKSNSLRQSLNEKIKQLTLEMVNNHRSKDTYYELIRNELDPASNSIHFVTSNYTQVAEYSIFGSDSPDNFAYIHGRLDLFESLEDKQVLPISEHKPDAILFPFLFVQSGIKPVVCSKQIQEMAKASSFIQDSDLLIILGYGINNDDDHINSQLITRLKKGKRILLFIHEDKNAPSIIKAAHNAFAGYEENYRFVPTSKYADVIEILKNNDGLESIVAGVDSYHRDLYSLTEGERNNG